MEQDSQLSGRLQNTMLLSSSTSGSADSITTHPLLSPPPSSLETPSGPSSNTHATASPPRYVPYTPRQRPIGTATTSTTLSSSVATTTAPGSSLNNHGGAASKLQLQSLKASVQTMGLDNNCVGWAILEKLVSENLDGIDWDGIWHVISSGQVALLLPTEKAPTGFIVTPDLVRDHIAFCNGPVKELTSIVTLGGLRGFVDEQSVTFRTALSTSSETFISIQRTSSRSAALSALSPLSTGCDPNVPYPTYRISDHQTSLHIPPRPIPSHPPPLPPRPVVNTAASAASTSSSLSGRFASLFGSRASTPVPSSSSPNITSSPIAATSKDPLFLPPRAGSPQPTPSIMSEASVESMQSGTGNPYSTDGHFVMAFAIDKKVVRKEVSKAVTKALKADVKIRLANAPKAPAAPSWVTDRILSFTAPLQPLAKHAGSSPGTSPSSPLASKHSKESVSAQTVIDLSTAHNMSLSVQDFYDSIEEELRKDRSWAAQTTRKKSVDISNATEAGEDSAKDGGSEPGATAVSNEDLLEDAIRETMELVEGCVTSVFYDRLFMPQTSDDSSHDEALANRIAALNMLDLGWHHLGVEIDTSNPTANRGIDEVVNACGREMQKLHDVAYRSPQAKAGLLIGVHRAIVDGLSHLPPVRLKPDGEAIESNDLEMPLDTKTPRQESFSKTATSTSTISPLHQAQRVDSPLHMDTPSVILTPDSNLSPHLRQSSILSSPRMRQGSLRSSSPGPSPNSSPRPLSLSLALPDSENASLAPIEEEAPRPAGKTAVNTDVLLPIIIFSVVKANPVQLVSQLLFIQRFRSRQVGGEESFCLINFLAVVEFLEHVDMQALGLGDADRVMSTQDLTPLPLSTSAGPTPSSSASTSAKLRGRVEQQVGELASGAGKVISGVGGVVDSSFTALRGLLNVIPDPAANDEGRNTSTPAAVVSSIITRPGFGLLRRGTSFSIAGVAANLPGGGGKNAELGQQMIEVPSRPGSVRQLPMDDDDDEYNNSSRSDSDGSQDDNTSEAGESTTEGDQDETHREGSLFRDKSDTRSIRSFSSMMSGRDRDDEREGTSGKDKKDRPSLSDRLANMHSLGRFGGKEATGTPPGSRRGSLLPPPRQDGPSSSTADKISPPNAHFLQSTADDLKLSEVPILLAEYKRVVEALRQHGGFRE